MSEPLFNDVVHQPHRLRICVLLASADEVAFQVLCEQLGLGMPTLSKQLKVLTDAGYVVTRKSFARGRAATWARLTPDGRRALTGHLAALRAMADSLD